MQLIAKEVGYKLVSKKWLLATAESCTGGLVAKLITDVAGSSQWFDRGFVTYTNIAKIQMLGVSTNTLENHGAVSEPVVEEMVGGAIIHSEADCSIAISGVAGPGGGSEAKPIGTVCFAWSVPFQPITTETYYFAGDREEIREKAAIYCLQKLSDLIQT